MPKTTSVVAAMGLTVRDYLAFADARPDQRFELIDGQPVAMAPATRAHQVVCRNVDYGLARQLAGRDCEVLRDFGMASSEHADFMPQPDVMVRCGPLAGDERWAADPIVLFEVLSPSTAVRDRGRKRDRYFKVPTLRHLVFVSPTTIGIEAWHRAEDGNWPGAPELLSDRDGILELTAVGAALSVADIYRDLDL